MNPSRWKERLLAGRCWRPPHRATAPGPATQPWQVQPQLQPATDATSCSSFPFNPKISRQTAAKGLVSQLDARIGPKAAATTSTVLTVGDWGKQAKLQKEHALGHSSNLFCFCGIWPCCGFCLCGRRATRPRGHGVKVESRGRGRPRPHKPHEHPNLVN
jgi:hypothetical protein